MLSPDGGGLPSPMETSTRDEFTARFLFSGRVKLKRESLGSEEEDKEDLIGGERWLGRSVGGGECRSDEKVEEAAMVEEKKKSCEIFLEEKKKKHLHKYLY